MARIAARLLAPLALAAVAVGVYLIIHANMSALTTAHTTSSVVHAHHHRGGAHHAARATSASTYTVRSGDTLSAIAARTHVSIIKLTRLNPKLHPPYNLQAGQRLRLRR